MERRFASEAATAATASARPASRTWWRWSLAALGCVCVGLGAVGLVVPGMPGTVFLLVASWAFAKGCPWLEERLLGGRLGAPVRRYRATGAMPLRAKVVAVATMWVGIGIGTATLARAGWGPGVLSLLTLAGLIGTYVLVFRIRTAGGDIASDGLTRRDR